MLFCSPGCFQRGKMDHDRACYYAQHNGRNSYYFENGVHTNVDGFSRDQIKKHHVHKFPTHRNVDQRLNVNVPSSQNAFANGNNPVYDNNQYHRTRVFENSAYKSAFPPNAQEKPIRSRDVQIPRSSSTNRPYDPHPNGNFKTMNPFSSNKANQNIFSEDPKSRSSSGSGHQSYDRPNSESNLRHKNFDSTTPNTKLPQYHKSKTVFHDVIKQGKVLKSNQAKPTSKTIESKYTHQKTVIQAIKKESTPPQKSQSNFQEPSHISAESTKSINPPQKSSIQARRNESRPANVFQLLRPDSSCDTSDVEDIKTDQSKKNIVKVETKTDAEIVLISKAEKKKAKKERQKQEAKQKQILRAQGDVKQKLKDNIIKIERESSHKNYTSAQKLILQAFEMNPTPEDKVKLYKLRIKVYLAQKDYEAILVETTRVLEILPGDTVSKTQFASASLAIGDVERWKLFYGEYNCNSLRYTQTMFLKLEKLMTEVKSKESCRKYPEAHYALLECLKISPSSAKLVCWEVKLCSLCKDFSDADNALKKLESMKQKVKTSEQSLMRGIYFYCKGKLKDAINHFTEALNDAKDAEVWLKKTQKMKNFSELLTHIINSGSDGAEKESEVLKAYENASLIDPEHEDFNVEINLKMASFYETCAENNEEAIEYLDRALKINDSHDSALNMRGMLKLSLERHEEAITDFRKAYKVSNNKTYLKKLHDVEILLRSKKVEEKENERQERREAKARMKAGMNSTETFYDILGVTREASQTEIKTAFKEKARALHPDKHTTEGEEVVSKMEDKMKDVNRAYR